MEVRQLLHPTYLTALTNCTAQLRNENPVRTLQQGAATIVLAAIDPSWRSKPSSSFIPLFRWLTLQLGQSPAYLAECDTRDALDRVTSDENVLKMWAVGEKLVGQQFPL
jgi:hypothetical protein